MKDLVIVDYFENEDYMLGAFVVKSEKTGQVFVLDPSTAGPFTLYFDNELFCWMIDQSKNLVWNNDEEKWVD